MLDTINQKKNILILSAGRRVELIESFQREVQTRRLSSRVLAADSRPNLSAACQIADESISLIQITEPSFVDALLNLCIEYEIGLVIPTIDTGLTSLSRHRIQFYENGIHLIISDEGLVNSCRDKRKTSLIFSNLGIDTPKIYDKNSLTFPCFAKPYDGSRSLGASLLDSQESVTSSMLSDPKLMFMEFIDASHQEYTVDTYYDRSGQLTCLVPRQRLEVRDGEISKGVTRRHELYYYLKDKVDKVDGARGCLTWQIFFNDKIKSYAAIEINPRFGGGYPLSYAAGANYSGWLIDEYILGKQIDFFDDWENNLMMLRYDAKVITHDFK